MTTQYTPKEAPTAEKRKALKKLKHPKRWLALLLVILLCIIIAVRAFSGKAE